MQKKLEISWNQVKTKIHTFVIQYTIELTEVSNKYVTTYLVTWDSGEVYFETNRARKRQFRSSVDT